MAYRFLSGNARYSSWSMRVGVLLHVLGVPYETVWIFLRKPDTKARILEISPAGRVPVLQDGGLTVWDSLAIAEYLAARHPDAVLWPQDPAQCAIARSAVAEMHSGFLGLRSELPLNLGRQGLKIAWSAQAQADIERAVGLLSGLRGTYGAGGPFLFGTHFTIADAFFAPVMERFTTYSVALPADLESYRQTLRAHPAVDVWHRYAAAETELIEDFEALG